MEALDAVARLASLAHEGRLRAFRLLVRDRPEGRSAGAIAAALGMPPPTLSFHMKHLASAGLVASRREGRSVIYSVRDEGVRELFAYLSADCCQGRRELCPPLGEVGEVADPRIADASSTAVRPTVLFLCSRNSARSQMAEALLRRRAGERFTVHSAGLRPESVHPMTVRVLDELGVDTSALRAKDLGAFLGRIPVHVAIVVCDRANRDCAHIYPFAAERLYWPFEDPAAFEGTHAECLRKFREVRDAIDRRLEAWLRDGAGSLKRAR